jgi:RimJ/RimL family protein N-acetyltransferase
VLTPPDPPLVDGAILLRAPAEEDVEWIAAACRDPLIARWNVRIPQPYRLADARDWVAASAEQWDGGTEASFVAVSAVTGEGLGAIGLVLLGEGLAETGYWMRPEMRGRGVATAALRLVAAWAFDELGVERLQLTTHPENAASQRVAEKAGFRREGVMRRWLVTREGRRDSVMFSLLPGELVC